jgi:transcription elongation factor GreB
VSKAFTKEDDERDEELPDDGPALPEGAPNYLTPEGFRRLQDELRELSAQAERPRAVERRLRYLTRGLERAQVVEPVPRDRVFFGARVTYADGRGDEHTVTIVGVDEADPDRGLVSWVSPLARALLGASEGATVELRTPAGRETLEVVSIAYG